jgi:hypothetical protein
MPPTADVLTNRYDNARTGFNLAETVLNTGNVNPAQFGLLFSRAVDGQVYAQPLVVSGLALPGVGTKAVVYVATANNNVYCYDAADPAAIAPYWKKNLGTPVPHTDYGTTYHDFKENVGVVSTPAIDVGLGAMWVVAKTKESRADGVHYVYRLHALALADGGEMFGGPVVIADSLADTFVSGPTFPGTGVNPPKGVPAGVVALSAYRHLNRPGLLLDGGLLYLAFGSHGDQQPYHGWVLAYDARALTLKGVYCNTPTGGEGGIWQSGNGLAADGDGTVFAVAGNGQAGAVPTPGRPDFGTNVVKLRLNGASLDVADWFAPFDAQALNALDKDLCSGPVLLPGTNLVLATGKDGKYYALDRANMGKFVPSGNNSQAHQVFQATAYHIHGTPPCWARGADTLSYVWSESDALKAYRLTGGSFQTSPVATGEVFLPADEHHMPGGILTGSADGNHPGTGIVWATHPVCGDTNFDIVGGIVRAFDAGDVSRELWNSEMAGDHGDRLGNLAKFTPPVVANGRVYVATFSDALRVYGLLPVPRTPDPCEAGWQQRDVGSSVSGFGAISCAKFAVTGGGSDIWGTADGFHFLFRPFTGDGQIVARVSTISAKSPWAKSGVMFRATLDPGSPHAFMALTTGNGAAFQRRLAAGGVSVHTQGPNVAAPYWVKLVRAGNTLTGFISGDGVNWGAAIGTDTVPMPPDLLAGLAVTSHNIDQFRPVDGTFAIDACQQNETVFLNVTVS